MVDSVRQDTTNPNTVRIDARPYQLDLLKVERRGMRPMALKVLNGSQSTRVKLAAVASVAAMLVSLNATSEAYAAKLNLKPAIAEQSALVLRDAVACCNQLAEFVTVGAPETAIKEQIFSLFGLIDAEHKRLEAFADELGARLVPAGGQPAPEADAEPVQGGGGEKTNVFWLSQSRAPAALPDLQGDEEDVQGGGGEKANVSWLSQLKIPAMLPDLQGGEDGVQGGGGEKTNVSWLSQLKTPAPSDSRSLFR